MVKLIKEEEIAHMKFLMDGKMAWEYLQTSPLAIPAMSFTQVNPQLNHISLRDKNPRFKCYLLNGHPISKISKLTT